MSNKQETIADIVAEMRLGVKDWKGERLEVFDCFADRIEASHQREVAGLKSKMNDVVCENEALRDACGTCGAKLEVAELEREVAELRACLKMAVVNARIARTCYAFGRECDSCGQSCNARKWKKVIEVTKGANHECK